MRFARIINGAISDYPVSIGELRLRYGELALPADLATCELLQADGWVVVHDSDKPSYDAETQNLNEVTPTFVNSVWYQSWQVVDKPTQEVIDKSKQRLEYALMQKITDTAKQHNYDDIAEVGVYASTVNIYQTDAQAIVVWAAQCWQAFYALNGLVDVDSFMLELPELVL